ncbi:MAG: hypothetical protein ACI4RV_06330 [Eubacteriales bacterium]
MAVKYEIKEYSVFGKCVCIDNGVMELYVTVDIGPRIIKLNLKGKENMMFNDEKLAIYHDEPNLKDMFGADARWYIYGGHRFWISPEKHPETYYPDNEPVAYDIKENVFTFYAPKQIFTGWQETMIVTVSESKAEASVEHVLTNMSERTQTGAIWGLNVTDKGGKAYVAQATEDTGLLANRTLMLWPYNVMTDKRFYMDDTYVGLAQETDAKAAFKIGVNNTRGKAVCVNHGTAFCISTDYIPGAVYPDNGCSCEMYSCANFLEVETLSPLYTLNPGESCRHTEHWSLFPEEATDVKKLAQYLA